jgi:alpha-L-rhamnosidase
MPQPGDLSWAQGRVPTPFGPIQVDWEKSSNRFTLNVTVPAGTTGTIGVPSAENQTTLIVNGRKITAERNALDVSPAANTGSRDGYVYLKDLAPGTYQIMASQSLHEWRDCS